MVGTPGRQPPPLIPGSHPATPRTHLGRSWSTGRANRTEHTWQPQRGAHRPPAVEAETSACPLKRWRGNTPSCTSVLRYGQVVSTPGHQPPPASTGSPHPIYGTLPNRSWGLKGTIPPIHGSGNLPVISLWSSWTRPQRFRDEASSPWCSTLSPGPSSTSKPLRFVLLFPF